MAQFAGELCHGAKDVPRSEANRIMVALRGKMEEENWFEKGTVEEKDMSAMYEVPTMVPKREYLDIYEHTKVTLKGLGWAGRK